MFIYTYVHAYLHLCFSHLVRFSLCMHVVLHKWKKVQP